MPEESLEQQIPDVKDATNSSVDATPHPGSTVEAQERRKAARANRVRKGLVIVNTGNGKG
ncbi:MAG: cob(I)yrinic acid a,c-diamide adenosyltransferase, partial [Roseiflexus sp.]